MLLADGRQVGQEDTVALEVEDRDLHQTAGELHADDVVFGAIEIQTDGTAVLVSVHVAGFFDDALRQQFRGDFGDCRRSELDGFGDLRARADAVLVQMLHDPRTVGFGH